MRKPPVPAEENPKNHQENPGEPPANHTKAVQEGKESASGQQSPQGTDRPEGR